MKPNLYPIIYNPGIQRDGTQFQGDYCLDGKWIRFQRGKVKKIGGMKGVPPGEALADVSNLTIVPWKGGGEDVLTFISHRAGISIIISSINWDLVRYQSLQVIPISRTTLWETTIVINKNSTKAYVVFMKNNNALNINDNSASTFFAQEIVTTGGGAITKNPLTNVNALSNGGLCFSAPYLFIYGSNGIVQYSQSADPFKFNGADSGALTISNDKVIFGSPIRGGSNSPSLLFWTLSSVVRVVNAGTDKVDFRSDVISNSSSILSSKCVVEYDGLFFWPGTERFFVYNGIVQEMDNRMNLNYFYDNIDMDFRQNVFGVKNAKFGEIWWYYPVKGSNGLNVKALVYNKRENFWYDADISRSAGTFSSDFGFVATYGRPIVNDNNTQHLWKHEVADGQDWTPPGQGRQIDPIPSSFTTPIFSWVAFPPKPAKGAMPSQFVNRWIDLQRIEPDFVATKLDAADVAKMQVKVNTQEYAQSPVVSTNPIFFGSDTPKLDMRVQGRNMSLTFGSSDAFEAGQIILLLGIGDER